jgi:hypothetical protein
MNDYSFAYHSAYLYRKTVTSCRSRVTILLVISLFVVSVPATAQSKRPGGPRAIGVVTWNGDDPMPTPAASVLTPVAILVEGRYYDAELYQAQPQPLAIDSGVVYSVLKNGEEIGTFNIGGARERDGIWYGTGFFDLKTAKKVKPTQAAPPKSAPAVPEEDRPRLRRGPAPPPPPKQQTDAVLSSIDRDPERPTLRHHSAEEQQAKKQASGPQKEFVPPAMHMLVAVSDAGGPEPRPFAFRAKAGELDQLQAMMEKLARAELDKQRKAPEPPEKRTTTTRGHSHAPTPRLSLQLQNAKLGTFDVNYDNAPIVVYSASANVDGVKKYITVAAWEEIDSSMRKIFAQVTDDQHLDVYPRLEVIDAVDASGNGRGELLFRAYGDQGSRFVLYHPGPDSLNLLFDSARGESRR